MMQNQPTADVAYIARLIEDLSPAEMRQLLGLVPELRAQALAIDASRAMMAQWIEDQMAVQPLAVDLDDFSPSMPDWARDQMALHGDDPDSSDD